MSFHALTQSIRSCWHVNQLRQKRCMGGFDIQVIFDVPYPGFTGEKIQVSYGAVCCLLLLWLGCSSMAASTSNTLSLASIASLLLFCICLCNVLEPAWHVTAAHGFACSLAQPHIGQQVRTHLTLHPGDLTDDKHPLPRCSNFFFDPLPSTSFELSSIPEGNTIDDQLTHVDIITVFENENDATTTNDVTTTNNNNHAEECCVSTISSPMWMTSLWHLTMTTQNSNTQSSEEEESDSVFENENDTTTTNDVTTIAEVWLNGSTLGFYECRGLTAAPVKQSKPLCPPPLTPYSLVSGGEAGFWLTEECEGGECDWRVESVLDSCFERQRQHCMRNLVDWKNYKDKRANYMWHALFSTRCSSFHHRVAHSCNRTASPIGMPSSCNIWRLTLAPANTSGPMFSRCSMLKYNESASNPGRTEISWRKQWRSSPSNAT